MSILEIKKFGEPVLKERAKPVRKIDKEIRKLIVSMVQTMEKNQGIGLAAPQIGILKRIIVLQADLKNQRILVLVNPKILSKSRGTKKNEEGCLSFPNVFLEIKRAKEIEVEGVDITGKKIKIKAEGLLARVLQHEIDHLNGVLFFKRLGLFQRLKFRLKYGFN